MGCCVSKCRPEYKPSLQEKLHDDEDDDNFICNHVQDKLPISQTPPINPPTTLYSSTKISPCPPSPTSSTSSISSFTCTTSNTISSASSFSTASSSLSSKDRSFSNEFLWSCYKENPHIARINSLTSPSFLHTSKNPKLHHRNIVNINPSPPTPKSNFPTLKQPLPQKRLRSNSPTNLTRQKSFRKETEKSININYASSMQTSRTLRSPSPSRRFNIGDKCGTTNTNLATDDGVSKRMMNSSKVSNSTVNAAQYRSGFSSSARKVSVKAMSPNNYSRRVLHSGLRNTESCTSEVGSKVDETVVKDVVSDHDMDLTMMEDIDNPLIALDCFIFL